MNALDAFALSKTFTKHVALGIASMSVSGTTVTFVTTDGVTASVTLPTPADGVGIQGVAIDSNCHLICTMTDGSTIDAGLIGSALSSDLTANVSIGSVASGTTFPAGTSLEEIIRKMLTVYQKPGIALVITPSTTVYDVVSETLPSIVMKAIVKKTSKDITQVVFKAGDETIYTITTGVSEGGEFTYTYTPSGSINTDTTFTVTASDEDNQVVASTTVKFVAKSYWGIVADEVSSPAESDIKGLANNSLKTAKGLTYSDIIMTNSRIVYAYPKSFGALTSIVSKEGYDYMSSYVQTTVSVDSIDYFCYTLKDSASITTAGYKQIFA